MTLKKRQPPSRKTIPNLFISFWHISLVNLPAGTFKKRRLTPQVAKRLINGARKGESLIGVSDDDLFAPYRKTERKNHEALCQVLTEHFAIPISLRDFANGWDEDDPGYWINPLQFAHITGGNKLVIVTCCYVLEKPTKEKSPLVFTIDPATVEFHLLESAPESVS